MQTYTVRHGDTLMQIAKEQHVEPTLLKKFNPTAARRPLLAGQTLLLPRKVRGGRVRAVCATPTSSLSLLREQTGNYVPSAVQRLHSHIAVTGGAIQNGVLPYIPRLLLDRRFPNRLPLDLRCLRLLASFCTVLEDHGQQQQEKTLKSFPAAV